MNKLSKKNILIATQLEDSQRELWQVALETQMLQVNQKHDDYDLVDFLENNQQNNISLPDIVLVNASIKTPNSEALQSASVCIWSNKHYPELKIFIFNSKKDTIKEIERNWAIRRGAKDIFPRLTRENIESSVFRIVSELNCEFYPDFLEAVSLCL